MKNFLLLIAVVFSLESCTKEQAKPVPSSSSQSISQSKNAQPVPEFDGKQAFSFLTAQTDFGPRTPGSDGHANCLAYLQEKMQGYADAVNPQPFTTEGYDGEVLNLTNVIASFNLKATKRVLLIAHWDTRPRADQEKDPKKQKMPILGANDGASGVAVLMEIARHLKTTPPQIGVDMIFVDGEDYGKEGDTKFYLLGAKYFVKNMPQGFDPQFGILLDMIGDKELTIKKEQFSLKYAPDIVDLVWSTARDIGVTQFVDEEQAWVTDDHLPFDEVGIKTIDLIDFEYPDSTNRYWHTLEDTPDKCSAESLAAVGKVILTVLYRQTP